MREGDRGFSLSSSRYFRANSPSPWPYATVIHTQTPAIKDGSASDDPDPVACVLSPCSRCRKAKSAREQRKREADGRFNPLGPYFNEGRAGNEMSNLKDGNPVEERQGVQAYAPTVRTEGTKPKPY